MTANPGTLTERMQLAAKELEARQASAVQLAAQAKQTEDALKQAGNTIAEVQGLQKTLPAQLEQAKATQAKAKAAKDSLTAAKAQLETEAKGRETVLAEMRAMVARLKDQVQKAPMDKAMPQAATRAQAFLTQLEQEAAPALAKMKELEPKLALETKAQADADAQVAALTAQVAGLPKRLTDSQAAQKALGDQLKARQTAAQQAQADLLRLQGIVERLKSRQSTVSAQPAKPAGS
jgi:chromosome segregation ATPase